MDTNRVFRTLLSDQCCRWLCAAFQFLEHTTEFCSKLISSIVSLLRRGNHKSSFWQLQLASHTSCVPLHGSRWDLTVRFLSSPSLSPGGDVPGAGNSVPTWVPRIRRSTAEQSSDVFALVLTILMDVDFGASFKAKGPVSTNFSLYWLRISVRSRYWLRVQSALIPLRLICFQFLQARIFTIDMFLIHACDDTDCNNRLIF